jgi:hypothetical protein
MRGTFAQKEGIYTMGESLNRTAANTVYTWLTAANNQANLKQDVAVEIAAMPNTNTAGELTAVTHNELKMLYRANAYQSLSRFTF